MTVIQQQTSFLCVSCQQGMLSPFEHQLKCSHCSGCYALTVNSIPILVPPQEAQLQAIREEQETLTLDALQATYDLAYTHDGLMGTDLDGNYDQATKETLLSFATPLAGKRVLDIGTGIGKLWDYVQDDVESYAIDPSAVGLSKAKQRHPHLTTSVSIAEYLPYPDHFFHVVLAADTLEHTFAPTQALAEIYRVLEPGGILSASLPVPDSLRKWGWNQLIKQRPQLNFVWNLTKTVWKRFRIFGRADFQPIDRDYTISEWHQYIQQAGFTLEETIHWPSPPQIPIVYLTKAIKPITS